MRYLFYLIIFFLPYLCDAQSLTVQIDTTQLGSNTVQKTLTINSTFEGAEYIEIQHIQIIEQDSLIVFAGRYTWLEDDPSAFKTFQINPSSQSLVLGIGNFNEGQYYTHIFYKRYDMIAEERIVN